MTSTKPAIKPKAEFMKTIRELTAGRHHLWRIFSDFCEMAALSFSQVPFKDETREQRYMDIIKEYSKDEAAQFPKLLACVVNGLEDEHQDFLGVVFQELELSSHWHGQFFTPYTLCKMMAMMTCQDAPEIIKQKGFITVGEPACGAGAMVIAMAEALKDQGINYQHQLHVQATDLDPTAAHMAYIQFSLLHIPAIVFIGNTISMKMTSAWPTPAHHLGFWDSKLKRGYALGSAEDNGEPVAAIVAVPEPAEPPKVGQLDFNL